VLEDNRATSRAALASRLTKVKSHTQAHRGTSMLIRYALPSGSAKHSRRDDCKNSDASLISSIAKGDQKALHALFSRHSTRVYRYSLRLTGSTTIAEETVSDVFLEVWCSASSYAGRSQVSTWLLGIARHKALSALQQSRDLQLDEHVASAIEDPTDNPEQILLKRSRGSVIERCVGQLPRSQRDVIELFYLREKSVAEVVAITGASKSTVKTRMFYGRSRMAELLGQAGIESARA
jgi:RNA polymerase sigma-70 factor, ECF subfamily